jgi:hypothetical protein
MHSIVDIRVFEHGRWWLSFNFPVKRCSRCQWWLPTPDCFSINRAAPDGLYFICKECHRKYRDANRDLISVRKACAYAANPEPTKLRAKRQKERAQERGPPSAELIRQLWNYDPETGMFTHPATGAAARMWKTPDGYLWLSFAGYSYRAHRVAFAYMCGVWPPNEIDHVNLDRVDNRWANLRAATRAQNTANKPLQRNNTSGFKGVNYHLGRFDARIRGKHLGRFVSAEEAAAVYAKAAYETYGEFTRLA